MMTLAKFEDAWRDNYVSQTPGVTKAEYNRWYPRGSRLQEWMNYIINGTATVTKQVLDDLYRRGDYSDRPALFARFVRHIGEDRVEAGYFFPWARGL